MVCALVVLCCLVLMAKEMQFTAADLPEAVIRAFQHSYPTVKALVYDVETINGKKHYEIETKNGKYQKDYVYLEDGTLLQTEEEIALKSLPEIVVQTIEKKYAGCEIDEATKIIRGAATEYEVAIEFDKKDFEVLVSSDGSLLTSDEVEDEGDSEEENKAHNEEADADSVQDDGEDD